MKIYIPSYKRSSGAGTARFIPEEWRDRTYFVVVPEEEELYRRKSPGIGVLVCPEKGIANTREWILWNADDDKILMMDDDLRFDVRRMDEPTKFYKTEELDRSLMLDEVDELLDSYAHGAIAHREGANRDARPFKEGGRMLRALAYRTDILKKHDIHFNRIRYMEDFDVALQMYQLGYQSGIVNSYCQGQAASSAEGGCGAEGRGPEQQEEAAFGLWELHPDFVTVVTKPPIKSGWWGDRERVDVRVEWAKAFKSAGVEREVG